MSLKVFRTDEDWLEFIEKAREPESNNLLNYYMELAKFCMNINKDQINPIQWTHYSWFDEHFQEPKSTGKTRLSELDEYKRKQKEFDEKWEEAQKKAVREIDRMARKIETPQELPGGSTPSQYGLPAEAKELQDLIEHRDMNFAIGNIFKACYRLGNCSHSDKLRDLRKIIWFAQRELDKESKK